MTDQAQKAALHSIWREAAEKGIEHGIDWPRVVLDLFRDLDRAEVEALADPHGPNYSPPARVITLCGSTRFKSQFETWNSRLTLLGNVVISVGVFGHSYHPYHREKYLDPKKPMLDRLHLQKIDMADEIFVIDPGFYVGESTRREIEHARATGKPVRFLSLEDVACEECGRDNENGTHAALERTGHLSHSFRAAAAPHNHPSRLTPPDSEQAR